MSEKLSKSVEQQATIPVPRDGVTVQQLSHYLSVLAEDIMVPSMDMLKSAPIDAQQLQLSITVSAIGVHQIRESLILTTPRGASSPIGPLPPGSLMPQFAAPMATKSSSSPTQRSRAGGEYHEFDLDEVVGNCRTCNMPGSAFQHQRASD